MCAQASAGCRRGCAGREYTLDGRDLWLEPCSFCQKGHAPAEINREEAPYLLMVRLLRCEPNRPCIMIIGPGPLILVFSGGSWRWKASSTTSSGFSWRRRVWELEKHRREVEGKAFVGSGSVLGRRGARIALSTDAAGEERWQDQS